MANDFDKFAEMEKAGWSDAGIASAYADRFAPAAEQCVPVFVDKVHAAPGAEILDLCCGQGIVAKGLAEAGARVTGMDISPAMIELARERVADVDFIEGDAMNLPFDDDSFDAVTIGFGIPHIPYPEKTLAEAKRVLRQGGRLALSVWYGPNISKGFGIAFEAVAKHGEKVSGMPPGPDAHAFSDRDYACNTLTRLGFSEPALERVESFWVVDDPNEVFSIFLEGSVRMAAMLRAQPAEKLEAIRIEMARSIVSKFGSTRPFRIPVPAAIISATA